MELIINNITDENLSARITIEYKNKKISNDVNSTRDMLRPENIHNINIVILGE